jgi:hypothetical protein
MLDFRVEINDFCAILTEKGFCAFDLASVRGFVKRVMT